MIAVSLIINTALFFIVLNLGYYRRRRQNPGYPEKPFHQLYLFPLALGIVYTYRGLLPRHCFSSAVDFPGCSPAVILDILCAGSPKTLKNKNFAYRVKLLYHLTYKNKRGGYC